MEAVSLARSCRAACLVIAANLQGGGGGAAAAATAAGVQLCNSCAVLCCWCWQRQVDVPESRGCVTLLLLLLVARSRGPEPSGLCSFGVVTLF